MITQRGKRNLKLIAAGALVGIANGLFGGGGGMIAVPFFQTVAGLDARRSHATCLALILPLCLAIVVAYTSAGGTSPSFGKVEIGVLIGGIIGALALKKIPSKALSVFFYSLMIVVGIRFSLK